MSRLIRFDLHGYSCVNNLNIVYTQVAQQLFSANSVRAVNDAYGPPDAIRRIFRVN